MADQKSKPIDVVYVLGKGSNWRNNEIRFSLRALEKNVKGVRRIYIVGEDPGFLKNVTIIQHPDEIGPNNADGNIIRKVLRACQEPGLSENFLFMNDDHMIMKPVVASEIPPYRKMDLAKFADMDRSAHPYFQDNAWRGRLWRTRNILVKMGYSAFHYDCHVPIVFNKKLFPEVVGRFDYARDIGYTMKSLYGNVVHGEGRQMKGEKVTIFRPYIYDDIVKMTKNRSFVAVNDDGLKVPMKHWLCRQFPEPSKYEKKAEMDPFFEIVSWVFSKEKSFETGCRLYDKYGLSRKAKKYLSRGESKARYAKLEYKLAELLNYY